MPRAILLTGFGPFGTHAVNPSAEVVARLAKTPPPGVSLTTLVLPVSYQRAFPLVAARLRRRRFAAVLHLGLGAARTRIEFERFALNWRGGAAPDEDGVLVEGLPIDPAGPAAHLATAPVERLAAAAAAAGAPAGTSSHAGTFLCNQTLYQTLRWFDRSGSRCAVAFAHLPPLPGDGAGMELDTMVAGIAASLGVLSEDPPGRPRRVTSPGASRAPGSRKGRAGRRR